MTHAIRASLFASIRIANQDSEQNRTATMPLRKATRDAILSRDPAAARAAMQVHLENTEQRRKALAPARPSRKCGR